MGGLLFNGLHSQNDLGLVMRSKNRMWLSTRKNEFVDIPGKDGSIVIPGAREDKVWEVELATSQIPLASLRKKGRQVAAWLDTNGARVTMIFDDEPDLYDMAVVVNQLDVDESIAMTGRITVQFRCLPYSISVDEYTFRQLIDTGLFSIDYGGTDICPPIITITAINLGASGMDRAVDVTGAWDPNESVVSTMTNLALVVGARTLIYTGTLAGGQSLILDCEKMKATKSGLNVTNDISGNWPLLVPGDNWIGLSDDTSTTGGIVDITYRERWK